MNILIAGGTGLIGRRLTEILSMQGDQLFLLTRKPSRAISSRITPVSWNAQTAGEWTAVLEKCHAVINLSGEPIAGKRWTEKQKKRIQESRIQTTGLLAKAILNSRNRPSVFISASGAGYYGSRSPGELLTEDSPAGVGFLAQTAVLWEKEAQRVVSAGVRCLTLRMGMILEKSGGGLSKLIPPFLFFAGGPLGNGRQAMPWIHAEDVCGFISYALKTETVSGPVNLAAPQIVTNREFCSILSRVLNRPSWLPVPAPILRFLLGQMAQELLLAGQKLSLEKILRSGYRFKHPDLESALQSLLKGLK